MTPEVLDAADRLAPVLGPELTACLLQQRQAVDAAMGDVSSPAVATASVAVVRCLRRAPALADKLVELYPERSQFVDTFAETLAQVRSVMHKRLATTVEEENSTRAHYEDVCARQEKAAKDRTSLEQQLKMERKEREKQLRQMLEAETLSLEDLELIKAQSVATAKSLETQAKEEADRIATAFAERFAFLQAEVAKLQQELASIQKEHREEEAALRKRKMQLETKVAGWLAEYDKDMEVKEAELQKEQAAHAEVSKEVKQFEEQYKALRDEADAAAEEKRKRDEIQKAKQAEKHQDEAAAFIQKMWMQRKEGPVEEAKPAKKGKGKGKGGKKKK